MDLLVLARRSRPGHLRRGHRSRACSADPSITRASHVEPDAEGRWLADLTPVAGPVLGPFDLRSEALAAEQVGSEELAHHFPLSISLTTACRDRLLPFHSIPRPSPVSPARSRLPVRAAHRAWTARVAP